MQARCQKRMMFVVILSHMILVFPARELFLVRLVFFIQNSLIESARLLVDSHHHVRNEKT